ncbi:hypothetical protein J627_2441 [Acinetobacter sp. 1245593]|nr:hypothetical protein J535_3592 [Acinetobacter baumannii 1429530]EXC12096.1 hypothetical protein J533_3112 [Acinetobacter baumannii 4749]EXH12367.1 hypothetical protein J627_2441 [Acinetobacter sp. 1245593]
MLFLYSGLVFIKNNKNLYDSFYSKFIDCKIHLDAIDT